MGKVEHAYKRFGEKAVLSDFSLTLAEGRTTCLIGPSGCGKTTLMCVASGLLTLDGGSTTEIAGKRASFVFQEDRLLPWFDALGNLTAVGIDQETAKDALETMMLGADAHTAVQNLSGGMQRRVAIARALAAPADIFFLDEPLRGLDAATALPVLDAVRQAMKNKTALLITHRMDEAFALADVIMLADGPPLCIVATAEKTQFASEEALAQWVTETFPLLGMQAHLSN